MASYGRTEFCGLVAGRCDGGGEGARSFANIIREEIIYPIIPVIPLKCGGITGIILYNNRR